MRIVGVDLTANDAVMCLLDREAARFTVADCRVRKLSLKKDHTREDLQQFQFAFKQLMSDYHADKVVIKERMPKGKFAGGAISFKLESAIQLIPDIDVALISSKQIKSTLSDNPLPLSATEAGLKVFQETAFKVAYAAQMLK